MLLCLLQGSESQSDFQIDDVGSSKHAGPVKQYDIQIQPQAVVHGFGSEIREVIAQIASKDQKLKDLLNVSTAMRWPLCKDSGWFIGPIGGNGS